MLRRKPDMPLPVSVAAISSPNSKKRKRSSSSDSTSIESDDEADSEPPASPNSATSSVGSEDLPLSPPPAKRSCGTARTSGVKAAALAAAARAHAVKSDTGLESQQPSAKKLSPSAICAEELGLELSAISIEQSPPASSTASPVADDGLAQLAALSALVSFQLPSAAIGSASSPFKLAPARPQLLPPNEWVRDRMEIAYN